MNFQSITEIANELAERKGERLKPLSPGRIAKIEEMYGTALPEVYKEFLRLMGKGAGNYMRGSSVFYDELLSLRDGANRLVEENDLPPLPPDAFVFWMHQGYQAAYFNLHDGDDPPVYYFTEGKEMKEFILAEKSLTDFFVVQFEMSYPDF